MKKVVFIVILLLFSQNFYAYAEKSDKFIRDAQYMALYETAVIYYGLGKGLVKNKDLFSKWLVLQLPHTVSQVTVADLARKYVGLAYVFYAPNILTLDSNTILFMQNAASDKNISSSPESMKILDKMNNHKNMQFINDYIPHIITRLEMLANNKAPQADSISHNKIPINDMLYAIGVLAYDTGAGNIPKYIISRGKKYNGYDSLMLYVMSAEKQYEEVNRQNNLMVPFNQCLLNIDRVFSEIMVNEYFEKPAYTRSAYNDYKNGKRWTEKDIENSITDKQAAAAMKLVSGLCRKVQVDNREILY